MLCEGGAQVDAVNARGETPLHDAVGRGSVDLVRRLLDYGAEPRRRSDKSGKDAFGMAERWPDVLALLSRHSVAQGVRKVPQPSNLDSTSSEST